MPTYRNGEVPANLLVTFASGWLPNEGTWYHQLPPATHAKHLALVALAKRNTGRVLKISEGWGAYRPLHIQVYAKRVHGIFAATPGTSSHGMWWERMQCAAIDYGNWGYVYDYDRSDFYRDVRAVGLEPGLISPQRGYPDEPWHVVDKHPWAGGSAAGGGNITEDDMTPGEFLDTAIELVPGDPSTRRTVAQALRAIFTETEATIKRVDTARTQIADVAGAVWQYKAQHPLAKDAAGNPVQVTMADFLRYEPAEHENTRRMIGGLSAAVAPDVDYEKIAAEIAAAFPELDAHAFAVAAADEADRRERERLGS